MTTNNDDYLYARPRRNRPSRPVTWFLIVLPVIVLPIIAVASPLLDTHPVDQFRTTGTVIFDAPYPGGIDCDQATISNHLGAFNVECIEGGAVVGAINVPIWVRTDYRQHADPDDGSYPASWTQYVPETKTGSVVLFGCLCLTGLIMVIMGLTRRHQAANWSSY